MAGPEKNLGLAEILAHYGYEDPAPWHSTWPNQPGQLRRLSELPTFIEAMGVGKRFHITFDYDPTYPNMLLQAVVETPE